MTNQDLHDLAAPYALDVLDDDDRRAFEAHLRECEQCRTELRALAETVGVLAYANEGPAPPESLRDRILVAAREEGPSNVVSIRRRRTRLYAGVALAAAAVAALAIGLTAGLTGGPSTRLTVSEGVATITGLGAAPEGKVWELWVIEDGVARPAGLFPGGDKTVVRMTRPAPPGSTVAVTLERAGGVTVPTPPIRLQQEI